MSFSISRSLLKLMFIEWVMPSNHLILCRPLLLLPSILPSIRVFSNESALYIRWLKYWSFSFSISPSKEYSGLISFWIDWLIYFLSKGLSRVFSSTIIQKHQFFGTQLSLWYNSHMTTLFYVLICYPYIFLIECLLNHLLFYWASYFIIINEYWVLYMLQIQVSDDM